MNDNEEPSAASAGVSYGKDNAKRRIANMSGEWIPVGERLPDHGGTVVCRTKQRELQFGRVMTVTQYKDGSAAVSHHWRGYPDAPLEVTHWTPLPAPPPDFQ